MNSSLNTYKIKSNSNEKTISIYWKNSRMLLLKQPNTLMTSIVYDLKKTLYNKNVPKIL